VALLKAEELAALEGGTEAPSVAAGEMGYLQCYGLVDGASTPTAEEVRAAALALGIEYVVVLDRAASAHEAGSLLSVGGSAASRPVHAEGLVVAGRLYHAVYEAETAPGFEGYYNARIIGLPGCGSYGRTLEEARRNIREALELYVDVAIDDDGAPPEAGTPIG